MKYFIYIISLSGLIIFGWFNFVQAANLGKVIINEIAWMGTDADWADEWIELYNNTTSTIDITGWTLNASDSSPAITFSTSSTSSIAGNSYFLIERADDETTSIKADWFGSFGRGGLNNSGEKLELYDNLGNLIDSIDASYGWPAGDNDTKQTMERVNLEEWQTSLEPAGTPKAENSAITNQESTDFGNLQTEGTTTEKNTELKEKIVYPSGIIINELLPSPTGPDAKEEWIEIFNQNDFEVKLSDWQITDTTGRTTLYTFPIVVIIPGQGFLVLSRPTTSITLNNGEDGLKLSQPNGEIIDEVNYKKAPRGQSYNRTKSGWKWSSILTPGSTNIIPEPEPEPENQESESLQTAAVAEPLTQPKEKISISFLPFLVAAFTAIFSAAIIFLLKRKVAK